MTIPEGVLISVIALVSAWGGAWIQARRTRSQTLVDIAAALNSATESTTQILTEYRRRLDESDTELAEVRADLISERMARENLSRELEHERRARQMVEQTQRNNVRRIEDLETAERRLTAERDDLRLKWVESQRRIDYLTEQRLKLNAGIGLLINQLETDLNVKPVWRPEGTGTLT